MPKFKDTSNKNRKRKSAQPPKKSTMVDEEGNELFDVEYIYGKKLDQRDQEIKYLVKWVGFRKHESTWEPIDHLVSVHSTVKEYDLIQSRHIFYEKYLNKSLDNFVKHEISQPKNPESKPTDPPEETKENGFTFSGTPNGDGDQSRKRESGDFRKNQPSRILKHRAGKFEQRTGISGVYYKVEWEADEDGSKPKSGYFPIDDLKLYCPLLLIEYLEQKAFFKEAADQQKSIDFND